MSLAVHTKSWGGHMWAGLEEHYIAPVQVFKHTNMHGYEFFSVLCSGLLPRACVMRLCSTSMRQDITLALSQSISPLYLHTTFNLHIISCMKLIIVKAVRCGDWCEYFSAHTFAQNTQARWSYPTNVVLVTQIYDNIHRWDNNLSIL